MFVKLFTRILDSSIADNRRLRHFFIDLLLCADAKGYVMMTEGAIARRIGATLDEVQWGLVELQKPDPFSKSSDADGARIERLDGIGHGWRIINFEAYKATKNAEDMRTKTNERVRRFRESRKAVTPCNAPVTQCNAPVTPCNTIQSESKSEKQNESKEYPPTPQGGEVVGEQGQNELFPNLPAKPQPTPPKPRQPKLNPDQLEIPSTFSDELRQAVMQWAEYKAEKNQRYKPRGWAAFTAEIATEVESEAINSIRHSMAQGYSGRYGQAKNGNQAGPAKYQPREGEFIEI